jgi:hypothetical protein
MSVEKTAICKIEYDGWEWANSVLVKSPSGKTILLKAKFDETISDELRDRFSVWDNYYVKGTFGKGTQKFQEVLSYSLMLELYLLSLTK